MILARGAARAAALLLLAATAAADPAPATLEALMAGMARARGVVAEFRETKELALLSAPLESRGVLYFEPPDRMLRRTLEPARSDLLVNGKRVAFEDAAGAAPVDLSSDPSAREFVDNFTTIFRGDLDALRRRYDARFESDASGWRLVLEPKDPLLRRFVASLTLSGAGESMREMVLVERDGDRTTTRFDRVETDHVFTPEESAALFGTP
jgi:outer membrane lipoprotein-sorting protein